MAKVRAGFVSNSSSSSFILAAPPKTKLTMTITVDLKDFVESEIDNEESLVKHFAEEYGEEWKTDDWAKPLFRKCLKQINNGNTVYVGTVSSDDGGISELLYNQGINPDKPIVTLEGVSE